MIRLFTSCLLLLSSYCSFSQSQTEMNFHASKDFEKADKELNNVFQRIVKDYKEDIVFIKNLRDAQRLWIKFRDTEMKVKYPDRPKGYYGSSQPMCWYMYKTKLTQERIEKLKVWLTGIAEGDECMGSVKRRL